MICEKMGSINVWMVISNLMVCLVPQHRTKVRATQCDRLVGSKMAAIGQCSGRYMMDYMPRNLMERNCSVATRLGGVNQMTLDPSLYKRGKLNVPTGRNKQFLPHIKHQKSKPRVLKLKMWRCEINRTLTQSLEVWAEVTGLISSSSEVVAQI